VVKRAVTPADIRWKVTTGALAVIADLRRSWSDEVVKADKAALKEALCLYFNGAGGTADCTAKALNINPLGAQGSQKRFKMRWGVPGCGGKSGGLRLALLVDCDAKQVTIAGAWMRRDATTEEFEAAFASAQ
jgi:hypothetical protein